jgi:hypothetical protein
MTEERVTMDGKPSVVWTHTPAESTGQRDGDLDGFFEWREVVQHGPAGKVTTEVTEYSPTTQKPLRRETYTREGEVVHVVVQEADESGTLQTIAMFDAEEDEEASWVSRIVHRLIGWDRPWLAGCSPQQTAILNERLKHGMGVGFECMRHNKAHDLMLDMMFHYVARDLVWNCVPRSKPDSCRARLARHSYYNPGTPVEINVETCFFDEGEYSQSSILWHEMLHNHFGPHKIKPKGSAFFDNFDQVESCERMCFGPEPVTKCNCARCLRTNVCDERCKIYQDCTPNQTGYVCPCPKGPNKFRIFPTCSQCLAVCPSGLACFGYSKCIPVSVGCQTVPLKCP